MAGWKGNESGNYDMSDDGSNPPYDGSPALVVGSIETINVTVVVNHPHEGGFYVNAPGLVAVLGSGLSHVGPKPPPGQVPNEGLVFPVTIKATAPGFWPVTIMEGVELAEGFDTTKSICWTGIWVIEN